MSTSLSRPVSAPLDASWTQVFSSRLTKMHCPPAFGEASNLFFNVIPPLTFTSIPTLTSSKV